jgi:hypothetical protein
VHGAHRRRLLAGAEPGFRDHALADPALQRDVGEPGAHEAAVEIQPLILGQAIDDRSAGGIGA